jgi:hypothetical protein
MVDLNGENAIPLAGPRAIEGLGVAPELLTFGDDEVSMAWDSESNMLEITGPVLIVNGDFKAGYDTNDIVHDMILLGMDPNSTNAVGVQDNVIGWAHEWLDVSYTPLSWKGEIENVFKNAPGDWAGWNRPEDYPIQVTIRGLDDDWAPGRAVANFERRKRAQTITFETRTEGGEWEVTDRVTGASSDVVVLDAAGREKPVNDIRFTFDDPHLNDELVLDKLYYFSMYLEGQAWLSKADGEAIGTTYLPQSEPAAPSEGWTVFTDESDGELKAKRPDGSVVTLAE